MFLFDRVSQNYGMRIETSIIFQVIVIALYVIHLKNLTKRKFGDVFGIVDNEWDGVIGLSPYRTPLNRDFIHHRHEIFIA